MSDRFASVSWTADRNDAGLPFLLHCEDGPAISFRDGWKLYYWRGTQIPSKWIEDRPSLPPEVALGERQIERRRAAIEILGWDAILRGLNARVIDADPDPEIGTLVEVQLPDLDRPARFLKVRCATGRDFALGMPPEVETALAAQAWRRGVSLPKWITPEVRT